MTDPIVFQGSYADLKFVKTRSVAQVVVEIPIEQVQRFIKEFGAPIPGSEAPVAIARMVPGAKPLADNDAVEAPVAPEKRKPAEWDNMRYVQRAGILCSKPEFQNWIAHHEIYGGFINGIKPVTGDGAAMYVRRACGVRSRSEIDSFPKAQTAFDYLYLQYREDTGQTAVRTT